MMAATMPMTQLLAILPAIAPCAPKTSAAPPVFALPPLAEAEKIAKPAPPAAEEMPMDDVRPADPVTPSACPVIRMALPEATSARLIGPAPAAPSESADAEDDRAVEDTTDAPVATAQVLPLPTQMPSPPRLPEPQLQREGERTSQTSAKIDEPRDAPAGFERTAPALGGLPTMATANAFQALLVPGPVAPPAEPVLDLADDARWVETLAHEIVHANAEQQTLRFQLAPRELGALTIALNEGADGGLALSINTQSREAETAIATAQPRLIEELRAQGVRVSESTLSSGGHSGADQHRPHLFRQGPFVESAPRDDRLPAAHKPSLPQRFA